MCRRARRAQIIDGRIVAVQGREARIAAVAGRPASSCGADHGRFVMHRTFLRHRHHSRFLRGNCSPRRGGIAARPRRAASSTMAAALALGVGIERHDPIEPGESLDLPRPLRRIGQKRHQRIGKPLRRAIPLQKFRHDILADDQVGEDHAGQPLACIRAAARSISSMQRDAIGGDGRHAGERKLERHRAGRRQRRARGAERGPFLGRLDHDARRHRPAGNAGAHVRGKMRQRRQHQFHRADAGR